MITSLLSLSFLESICVACTDSLRTLPTWDLSLCFRIFLNLDCKLCRIPSEIQVSGDFFFFFVSPVSWCQGWNRQISLQSLSAWRFPLYSHTKDSILCCISFMRMLDPHFGLIFAMIMLSLMINSLRVNEIWCYYPNSLGIEPCFFQAICIKFYGTGTIQNPSLGNSGIDVSVVTVSKLFIIVSAFWSGKMYKAQNDAKNIFPRRIGYGPLFQKLLLY